MTNQNFKNTKTRQEVKKSKGAIKPHLPKSKKEDQEFGLGKQNIVMCPECKAAYYYKSWHHSLEDYQKLSEDKRIKFSICPACQMIKDKTYEGQVIIRGIMLDKKDEIINLIKNVAERAFKRDPMDRIIKIENNSISEVEVLTTENQLAVSIGKQVKRAFKGGAIEIKWSDEESVARVILDLK